MYRFLPGFREIAVFEKIIRFFILFFGWALQKGGQSPGKGPNIYQMYSGIEAFAVKYVLYSIAFRSRKKKVTTISDHRSSR